MNGKALQSLMKNYSVSEFLAPLRMMESSLKGIDIFSIERFFVVRTRAKNTSTYNPEKKYKIKTKKKIKT